MALARMSTSSRRRTALGSLRERMFRKADDNRVVGSPLVNWGYHRARNRLATH